MIWALISRTRINKKWYLYLIIASRSDWKMENEKVDTAIIFYEEI